VESGIIIRSADINDYQSLAKLYEALLLDSSKYDPYSVPDSKFDAEKLLKIMLENGKHKFLVAQDKDRLVGFYQVNIFYGGQLVQLEPSAIDRGLRRLKPLRVIAKVLRTTLGWIEPKVQPPPVFKDFTTGYMANSYVLPEYRGKGIYSQFAAAALDWFKENQIKAVYFYVYKENRIVVDFWEKQGFKPIRLIMRKEI